MVAAAATAAAALVAGTFGHLCRAELLPADCHSYVEVHEVRCAHCCNAVLVQAVVQMQNSMGIHINWCST